MKSRQYAARQKIRYLFERQGITCRNKRQAIAVLKGITLTQKFTKFVSKEMKQISVMKRKPADKSASGPAAGFLSSRDILRALKFLIARIHSFRMSRMFSANCGRLQKV